MVPTHDCQSNPRITGNAKNTHCMSLRRPEDKVTKQQNFVGLHRDGNPTAAPQTAAGRQAVYSTETVYLQTGDPRSVEPSTSKLRDATSALPSIQTTAR